MITIILLVLPHTVSADSINYQALKYGTSQESMASGYYVKPATVTANGDQYLVTMTIHTGTDLGKWPVTVLSINGAGPANVSKTQSSSGYDYSYSFEANDLSKTINSSISINVPNVYVAKHDISFKFDTSNLPALATANNSSSSSDQNSASENSSSAPKKQKSTKKVSNTSKKQAAQIKALNKKNQETQTAIIIGGCAAVVVLGVAAYFFIKRK